MRHYNLRSAVLARAALTILPMFGGEAFAQDAAMRDAPALEEVIVTSRRREENLQQTPLAITAISAQTLEDRNITSLEKIAELAPSMTTVKLAGSLGSAATFIRGIGMNEVILGQDAPIGLYIDGVYNGRNNNAFFDLVELERVEVLRGPQGTLFGRNTTGGAISVVTRSPPDESGGEIKVSHGNYDSNNIRVRIDSGLLGNSGLKLSAAYQHRQNDGTVDNRRTSDQHDPGAIDSDAFWGKAVGQWGELTATLSVDYNDLRGVPAYMQLSVASPDMQTFLGLSPTFGGGANPISPNYQGSAPNIATFPQQTLETRGAALTLNYDINAALSVKSITAWRDFDADSANSVGPANLTGRFGNTLATAVVRTVNGLFENPSRHVEQDQFSQELQLLGSLGNFQYVVGGYYFREDGSEDTLNNTVLVRPGGQYALYIPSRAAYSIANKSYAAFGQLTWKPAFFASRLELTGGVRFTTDEKYLQQTFATARIGDQSYDNTSMLASVNYQWTDDFMTYARYTTGFRSGGFNTRATGSIAFAFQPEKAKTSEVGFKAEFFAQRLRVNGSAYYTDYSDLQVSQFLGGTGGAGGTQINANAHYAGFELEAQAVPIDGLTLTGSVGYVDPKYDEIYFAAPPAGATAPGCTPGPIPTLVNCANIARFIYVSDWTAAAGINYVLPAASYGEWAVRTDYNYRSRRDYHSTNLAYLNPFGWTVGTPAYGLLSARVTLSDIRIAEQSRAQISAYVDNLADKKYVDSGIDFGSLGFGTAIFGARRSYGVELKASF